MEQGNKNKKTRTFIVSEDIKSARDILGSIRKTNNSRADINRINEEMYKSPEIFSILMRLMEKTCKPFADGRTIRAIAENNDKVCQNYVNQLVADFKVEQRLPKETVCLYAKGDVMVRMVSVETLERKKKVFDKEPSPDEIVAMGDEIQKIKNRNAFVREVEEIENPLEYYDLQAFGSTVKFIKVPIQDNGWTFNALANISGAVLAISPEIIVHQTLYPRLTSERIDTGEYDGYGEAVVMDVSMGKGLLESAYPAYVDYMLDKATNQLAKDARSTVVNLIQIQCDNMNDDEKDELVGAVLEKLSIKRNQSEETGIAEYANSKAGLPIVVTTKIGQTGEISATQIGGDYDAGSMTDTKFYQTVLYGAFRAIKQEFGILDDNAGFSGGETLEQIRSAETDMIESAQKALCTLWEDVFDRYLTQKGLERFVGAFRLEMNKPHTQADTDAENDKQTGLQNAEQVMNAVEGKSSAALKIFRAMLDMVDLPQEVITALDAVINPEGGSDNPDDNLEENPDDDDGGGSSILDGMGDGGTSPSERPEENPDDDTENDVDIGDDGGDNGRERLPGFSEDDFDDDEA